MKRVERVRKTVLASSILLLVMLFAVQVSTLRAAPEAPYGPFPDRVIIFYQAAETQAVPMIEAGEMTAWLYYLRLSENIQKAEESEKVDTIRTYGGGNQLLINPLETTEGFNPFSIREVREALNWLIDRNYIVNEIYKGRAVPRWTMFRAVSPDYSRIVDYAKMLEARYSYDFDKAKNQIFEALANAGAEYREGKWYYEDEPITINFLIRPEDERKDFGDYIANQLERVGFTVNRLYKRSADAFLLWGAYGPSKRGDWHIYTAGWAFTAVTAFDDGDPWFWYSPDNAPIFEEYGGPPLLREAIDKLNNAEYKSMEERIELIKRICELSLEDGVHIWIVDQIQVNPISSELGDKVVDLYGGGQSFWFIRTLRYKTGAGGDVKLGNRAMFIEGFNPVAGFSWLYDVYVYYLVADAGVFPHPHTGLYIPIRTSFTVETAGPDGKLSVPSDALIYDLASEKFKPVGSGVSATSKVTYKITWGKWHHGQPVTKADMLYTIAEVFKVTVETSPLYDPVAATAGRTLFTNLFKGVRFTSEDTVEVYVDYWHVDNSFIASMASVWPDTPWELQVLANKAVLEKKLAWSVDMADLWGVDQLDYTKGSSLDILSEILGRTTENYVPPELEGVVQASEAAARWSALKSFYQTRGHFWVSNGPYVFVSADTTALQLTHEAFREYPFKADKWDTMLTVKIPTVRVTEAPEKVVPGLAASFSLRAEVAGQPYDRVNIKYLLTDASGNLAASGVAKAFGGGAFKIELTGEDTAKLAVGVYSLKLIAVGEEAALPYLTEYTFTVTPAISYFESLSESLRAELSTRISSLENRVETLSGTVSELRNRLSSVEGTVNISIVLAALGVIIALVALILGLRRK
ncbi:MAG: ABC transporter substrate-binding protein [Thermoproteota archaeon]